MPPDTRIRIVEAAMRLFGEQGYAGTTIAEIERAAGLSAGSGAVYRHFPSKEAILDAGITHAIASSTDLAALLQSAGLQAQPLRDRLCAVARAGLRRLEDERDLNRLVLRDLGRFPDLLARVGREEMSRTMTAVSRWLRAQGDAVQSADVDWDAVAMVLMGAVTHFWILRDTFGEHPAGLSEERLIDAAVSLAAAAMTGGPGKEQR